MLNGYSLPADIPIFAEELTDLPELESGSFQRPRTGDEARELTPQQYRWLMEGLSIEQPKAHRPITGITAI